MRKTSFKLLHKLTLLSLAVLVAPAVASEPKDDFYPFGRAKFQCRHRTACNSPNGRSMVQQNGTPNWWALVAGQLW